LAFATIDTLITRSLVYGIQICIKFSPTGCVTNHLCPTALALCAKSQFVLPNAASRNFVARYRANQFWQHGLYPSMRPAGVT